MNSEIISRYTGQPARLPDDLRAQVERAWGGRPVQLYAFADLVRPPAQRINRSHPFWRLRQHAERLDLLEENTDGLFEFEKFGHTRTV